MQIVFRRRKVDTDAMERRKERIMSDSNLSQSTSSQKGTKRPVTQAEVDQMIVTIGSILETENPFFPGMTSFAPSPDQEHVVEILHGQGYYDRLRLILFNFATRLSALAAEMESKIGPDDKAVRTALGHEYENLRRYARTYFGLPLIANLIGTNFFRTLTRFVELQTLLNSLAAQESITADDVRQLSQIPIRAAASSAIPATVQPEQIGITKS
jgi:hypothetical protein